MSCVPTGRVGLTPEVSGFVVKQDEALPARLARGANAVRERGSQEASQLRKRLQESAESACEALARLRRGAQPAPVPVQAALVTDVFVPEAAAMPPARPQRARLERWLRPARMMLAGGLIRGHQIWLLTRRRLRLADRGRDIGALALVALRWLGRRLLAAPRSVQVLILAASGLWLAPWPDFAPAAEPETVLALAAAPVDKPREPELWKPVPGVIAAWHLEASELDRTAMKYRARRQANGARQDMLTWFEEPGDDGARPRNRLSGALAIEYYPGERPEPESLFVDAARRTALVGASIEKMSDGYRIFNKFGEIEIADAVITGAAGSRSCLVFRHVAGPVPMQYHGWFCAAAQRPLERATLGCLLDRVDMIGGGDASVRAYFARVERSRRACGSYPVAAAPAGWVDANGQMPDLKAAIPDSRKM